jgi:NAD(P)-dependent dehydrogenase (short-subunit alcohol dehydrogenase family)
MTAPATFAGKSVIVTGAKGGIGRQIALAFAAGGANVAVCDRITDDGMLAAVAKEIEGLGRRCLALGVDVRSAEQVDGLVARTVEEFGSLDILVNNAGASFRCAAEDLSPNGWSTIIDINLKGTFLCSQAAGRKMIEQQSGNIISIASISGIDGSPGSAHYGASKAGIINLTKSLSLEWARHGIRVNAVAPGPIDTAGAAALGKLTTEERAQRAAALPLGRTGQPRDVADAVLFLASEASSFITGETIVVRGGPLSE